MPTITLYGCKGGTGRTTAAAALSLGLMAESFDVVILDTDRDELVFENWAKHMADIAGSVWTGRVAPVQNVLELLAQKKGSETNPVEYTVIDTSRYPSDLRLMAFELSDLIVMPFGSFLDAKIGIERAAEAIPKGKRLVGLSHGPGTEILHLVREWMPLLSRTLPQDQRLQPFSKASDHFVRKTLNTKSPAIRGLEGTLRFLIRDISSEMMMQHLQPRPIKPAKALITPNASLAATAREIAVSS